MQEDKISVECQLFGENFRTDQLDIPNLDITIGLLRTPDPVGLKNYQGAFPAKFYGHCTFSPPADVQGNKLEWLLNFILEHKSKFAQLGYTYGHIHVWWYGVQGGMAFSAQEIGLIHQTGLDLWMTYVYEDS